MPDTGLTIDAMNSALPGVDDPVGAGDDEIRAVKSMLKNQFAGDPNPASGSWPQGELPTRVADKYDIPVTVGPRALNALPGAVAKVQAEVDALAGVTGPDASLYLPVGAIMLWAHPVLPARWQKMDGSPCGSAALQALYGANVPDWRDRWIVASGTAYPLGTTITPAAKTTAAGDHNHTGNTGEFTLTADMVPAHGHDFVTNTAAQNSVQSNGTGVGAIVITHVAGSTVQTGNTGAASTAAGKQIGGSAGGTAAPHKHTVSASGTHDHDIDVRPASYAAFYIIYAGPA